jgi:hypothetical protein
MKKEIEFGGYKILFDPYQFGMFHFTINDFTMSISHDAVADTASNFTEKTPDGYGKCMIDMEAFILNKIIKAYEEHRNSR